VDVPLSFGGVGLRMFFRDESRRYDSGRSRPGKDKSSNGKTETLTSRECLGKSNENPHT
jgi:hypothetical protein